MEELAQHRRREQVGEAARHDDVGQRPEAAAAAAAERGPRGREVGGGGGPAQRVGAQDEQLDAHLGRARRPAVENDRSAQPRDRLARGGGGRDRRHRQLLERNARLGGDGGDAGAQQRLHLVDGHVVQPARARAHGGRRHRAQHREGTGAHVDDAKHGVGRHPRLRHRLCARVAEAAPELELDVGGARRVVDCRLCLQVRRRRRRGVGRAAKAAEEREGRRLGPPRRRRARRGGEGRARCGGQGDRAELDAELVRRRAAESALEPRVSGDEDEVKLVAREAREQAGAHAAASPRRTHVS